jgi:predicted Rossmann fold nucleotide-binding protein DprA/Smf involved in DNA uptake
MLEVSELEREAKIKRKARKRRWSTIRDLPERSGKSESPEMMDESSRKVLEVLKRAAPRDLSIDEIAELAKMHRNTASKYVYALEREGKVVMTRQVGNAKLYSIKS